MSSIAFGLGPGGSDLDEEPDRPTSDSDIEAPRYFGRLETVLRPAISMMTPRRLSRVLTEADEGQPERLFESIMQIPGRDGHWRGITKQRRLSVVQIRQRALPIDKGATAKRAAAEVTALLAKGDARIGKRELLTANEYGFACAQIRWDKGRLWIPQIEPWDPRHFEVSETGDAILRRDDTGQLLPLRPGSWIVHRPAIGLGPTPVQRGLGRLGLLLTMLKYTSVNQWWQFGDVFGVPLRKVTIARGDSTKQARTEARKMASDGIMVLYAGQSMDIDSVKSADGGKLWPAQLAWADEQMSIGCLGQTMTIKDGSSRSQAEVHERVRIDIRDDDALSLADTVARDLYRWYAHFNYGMPLDADYTVEPAIERQDDPSDIIERASRLKSDHGIIVDPTWLAQATMPGAPFKIVDLGDDSDDSEPGDDDPGDVAASIPTGGSFDGLARDIAKRASELARSASQRRALAESGTDARLSAEAGISENG